MIKVKIKRFFSLFLAIVIICMSLPQTGIRMVQAAGDFPDAGGADGSATKPYIINEATDLPWLITNYATIKNKYILQLCNIDMQGISMSPIGTEADPFVGVYNGGGYIISNLTITDGTRTVGLFGSISNTGVVKNVSLVNTVISCTNIASGLSVGGIAGWSSGTIEGCSVSGSSTISGSTNGYTGVGGIVGSLSGTVRNCYSETTINAFSNTSSGGGIAGYTGSISANIINCYSISTLNVDAGSPEGAIVGNLWQASLSGNYYLITTASYAVGQDAGNASSPSNNGSIAATAANLKKLATYSGWDFAGIWYIVEDSVYPVLRAPAPELSMINLQINPAGNDSITVSNRAEGDTLYVYDAGIAGSLLGSGTVAAGQTSVVIDIGNLTAASGSVYVSASTSIRQEGGRTQKQYFTSTLPISEGFEGSMAIPGGWISNNVISTDLIWSVVNIGSDPVASPKTGTNMAQVGMYSANTGSSTRLSVDGGFSLPATGSYALSFWMYHCPDSDYGVNDQIQPQISIDGGNTWSDLGTPILRINGNTGWEQHTVSLNTYLNNPNVSVGLLGISDYGYNVYIDDIEVKEVSNPGKALTADTNNNDVDHDMEITFTDDAAFRAAITGVSFNGNALTSNQYTVSAGKITIKPSNADNNYLRVPATGNVVITATNYADSTVSQTINAGVVAGLTVTTQPVPGTASGDTFATQPVVTLKDQYNNTCSTGPSSTANVVATAKAGTGTWTLGGAGTKAAVAGVATFTDLTCILTSPGSGAITFTSTISVDSNTFAIPINTGKALAADVTSNNVDNDIIITFGADAAFEGAIVGVSYDGTVLTATTDYVVGSGKVTLKPSGGNVVLQTPTTGNVVITATGYNNSTVAQTINAGTVASLTVTTQPVPGAISGDIFVTQPVVTLKDQYGNICSTGPSSTADVVATAKAGTGTWTLGGTSTKASVAGVAIFTDLSGTLNSPGNGAITFTSTVAVDSNTFTVPMKAGKALTADTTDNNVDNDIIISFGADAAFEGAIEGVSYNGTVLTATTDYVVESGKVTLKPSGGNDVLQTPATGNVVITATGYSNSTVAQTINAGAVASLTVITQPVLGAASGDTFMTQPVVTLKDQYGNVCSSGPSATAEVVATAKAGTGTWTLGGTSTKAAVAGVATFTNLTCTLSSPGSGAVTFTSTATVDSNTFVIPENPGKVLTADTTDSYVDNDLEITFGADTAFEAAIAGVSYNGTVLTVTTDYVVESGKVTLKPSGGNAVLRTPSVGDVVITAMGYGNSTVTQTINAGTVADLMVTTQPVPGTVSGDTFATQPVVILKDQYGNTCSTGPSSTESVVATAKAGTGTWTIGGTTTIAAVAGLATFADLTCTMSSPVNGSVTFSIGSVTTDSSTFIIPKKAEVALTADTSGNDVDNDIEINFTTNSDFENAITGISFNGHALTTNQYTITAGKITLHPSNADNTYLRTPGTGNIVITATGYIDSIVSQTINYGAIASLAITQNITAPTSNGGLFANQPIITLKDQYGNTCTGNNSVEVTASKKDAGSWSLSGTMTLTVVNGVATFADLKATNAAQVSNAQIAFNATGLTETTSGIVTLPAPTAISSPSSPSSNNKVEEITVEVKQGETDNTVSQITIERTTDMEGNKSDTVTYEEEKAVETIEKLKEEGKDVARIVIPDENDEVTETTVNIPAKSLDVLSDGNINLQIDTQEAKIDIPKESLSDVSKSLKDNLYFNLVPIKKEEQRNEVGDRAKFEVELLNGDNNISVVGVPITIETNMPSTAVDITLPLTGITIPTNPTEREAFLKQLAVYIEHSDGDKELVQGEIVEYKDGVMGIKFHITKFSIFTIVKTDAFDKSSACSIKKISTPQKATIKGKNITASVTNATTSLTVKLTTSNKATWKLYSDKACKKKLTSHKLKLKVGMNKVYIKVTAEDGKTSKIYTLTITRIKASQKAIVIATKYDFSDALVGGILTMQLNGDMIRTGKTTKDAQKLVSYIKKNYGKTDKIYIIGLGQAVNADLEKILKKSGYKNIIKAGGEDKYETAKKIAFMMNLAKNPKVVLVNGELEPKDAKNIQIACAKLGYPILFIKRDSLTEYTVEALKEIKPTQTYIVGDKTQISTKAVNALKKNIGLDSSNVIRISTGKDIK